VRLFDRLPRGVRRTEAGEVLFDYARRIFQAEGEAERALLELQGLERGRLMIGASTTIGDHLLPDVLSRFHAQHPGIELTMTVSNTDIIQSHLIDGTLDLGFTEGFADDDVLDARVFLNDGLAVIAAPDAPILQEGPVTAERLCREPFVLRERGSGTRAVVERALSERGLTAQAVMSLGSSEAVKQCVMSGAGVGIVSRLTIARELASGELRVLEVADLPLHRPLHRLMLRGKHQGAATRAFLETLAQSVGEQLPIGRR
jgi:DNA-binding transcriptional LysR family regulator